MRWFCLWIVFWPGFLWADEIDDVLRLLEVEHIVTQIEKDARDLVAIKFGQETPNEQFGQKTALEIADIALDGLDTKAEFEIRFRRLWGESNLDGAIGLFRSELGQRTLANERNAAMGLSDLWVLRQAQTRMQHLRKSKPNLVSAFEDLVAVGNLVDENTAITLNSFLAIEQGYWAGRGEPEAARHYVNNLLGAEDFLRAKTLEWLEAWLALSYGFMTESEIRTLVAYWESAEGQRLNRILYSVTCDLHGRTIYHVGETIGAYAIDSDL